MTTTGIVRRIDELGRLVIPKEIRRSLRIRESDPIEICTDAEGNIVLRKYARIRELHEFARTVANTLSAALGCDTLITDAERVLCASGSAQQRYTDRNLSDAFCTMLRKKQSLVFDEMRPDKPILFSDQTETITAAAAVPITCHGDLCGSIILLGNERVRQFGTNEYQTLKAFCVYLGKLLEEE